jgi:hypothetical protein
VCTTTTATGAAATDCFKDVIEYKTGVNPIVNVIHFCALQITKCYWINDNFATFRIF